MLRLRLDQLMFERKLNPRKVSQLTGIRYSTLLDMRSHQSKVWSPEHLTALMKLFNLTEVDQLIEYCEEEGDPLTRSIAQQLEPLPPAERKQVLHSLLQRFGVEEENEDS